MELDSSQTYSENSFEMISRNKGKRPVRIDDNGTQASVPVASGSARGISLSLQPLPRMNLPAI